MRQKAPYQKHSAEKVVKDIRRKTRRRFSAEEKIRIVLEGLRGEESIAELCRKEGINQNLYYRWSKEFLEAGKKRLAGDTVVPPINIIVEFSTLGLHVISRPQLACNDDAAHQLSGLIQYCLTETVQLDAVAADPCSRTSASYMHDNNRNKLEEAFSDVLH